MQHPDGRDGVTPRAHALAPFHDEIERVRRSAHVLPEEVPDPKPGACLCEADLRRKRLARVADRSVVVMLFALAEVASQPAELRADCAYLEVDPEWAAALHGRIQELEVTIRRLRQVLEVSAQQLEVARSDAHQLLKRVDGSLRFARSRGVNVDDRWRAVLGYGSQHAGDIAKGKEQARRARAKPSGDAQR